MSTEVVQAHTIQLRTRRPEAIGNQAFSLEVAGRPLARFFVMPTGCTLAWDGVVDFSKIDNMALVDLSSRLSVAKWRFSSHYLHDATKVALLITGEKDQLLRLTLASIDDYAVYRKALARLSVTFVRYEVDLGISSLRYVFTAENPEFSTRHQPELALMLPKDQFWPMTLLNWILDHHVERQRIKQQIDVVALSELLRQLSNTDTSSAV